MEGLNENVLAFLVDIQSRGASQITALSGQFKVLGTSAELISRQLAVLQKQFDSLALQSTAAGTKVTASAKGAVANTKLQTDATGALSKAQQGQVGATDAVAGATTRLTEAQKVQARTAAGSAGALDAHGAAAAGAAGQVGGAHQATVAHAGSLDEHRSSLEKTTKATKDFGSAIMPVSVGLLAVGGYAVKMGLSFEASMERLHTQAGYAQKDIAGLEAQVLKAAPGLRRTPTELAEGLYHVASVGIPAADAMKVMAAASIGANIGGSNLDATANALVITLKNMHQPATSATADMALLNEIVGAGNLHMEELVGVLGKVLPQATNVGLNLRDVGSAMDVLTSRGLPAARAATILGQTFSKLESPSSTAKKAFAEIGLSGASLAEAMRKPDGLVGAVQLLKDHLDKAFPPGKPLGMAEKQQALLTYKKGLEESGASASSVEKDMQKYASSLVQTGSAATAQSQVLINAFGGSRMSAGVLTLIQNIGDLRKTYQRLPEGAVAIKQFQEDQKDWEKTSQANLDAIKSQFDTTMTSVGKSLGPIVLPALKEATTVVGDLGNAFQEASPPVKHLVGEILGIVAVAGPVLIGVSKLTHAASLFGGLGGKIFGAGSAAGGVGTPATLAAGSTTAVAAEQAVGHIWGLRGLQAPGSLMNPIAVQMIGAGPSVGGGLATGESAAVTAESQAARAGAVSAGGVLLPAGVTAGEAAAGAVAGEAGAIGVGSKLLTGGKTLLGAGMKGGMIALGGTAVADIAGTVIGGKTGGAVSSIGKDAAIGAGLGMLAGPEGAIVGGVAGALYGGFQKFIGGQAETEGKKVAEAAGKGMGTPVQEALQKGIDEANQPIKDLLTNAMKGHSLSNAQMEAAVKEAEGKQFKVGKQFGNVAVGQEMSATSGMSAIAQETAIITDSEKRLRGLPAAAQAGAFDSIMAMVKVYQQEGKLPPTAVGEVMKAIVAKFPALKAAFAGAGTDSVTALNNALKGQNTLTGVEALVNQWRNVFPQIPQIVGLNMADAEQTFATYSAKLLALAHTGPEAERAAAAELYKKFRDEEIKYFREGRHGIESEIHGLQGAMKQGAPGVVEPLETAFQRLVASIRAEMSAGVKATGTGMAQINAILTRELKILGIHAPSKQNQAFGPLPGGGANALQPTAPGGSSGFGGVESGATGMRVPGPAGPDNTGIYSPGGGLRGIVAGGELLVTNRHTEQRVDDMLRPYGTSLGAEVAGERTPHSAPPRYATGGYTGYSLPLPRGAMAGSWSIDQGVDIPAGAGTPEFAIGPGTIVSEGIQGFGPNAPVLEITAGPLKGRKIYYGHAGPDLVKPGQSVSAGQQISSVGAGIVGISSGPHIEIGFGPPFGHGDSMAELLHQLLGGAGVPGTAGGTASPIHAPHWKGPGGVIGSIGRAALARATNAANARLASAASKAGSSGSGIGAGSSPTGPVSGSLAQWLTEALNLTHHFSQPNLTALEGRAMQESSGNPHSINLTDSNAQAGHPSKGLLQTIPETFNTYKLPGHEDIWNPVDNAAAAIRYMFARYGHIVGPGAGGYATGGRMDYAGKFGGGGAVTASSPTMAVFGDNGPETAIFVPHAETGAQLLESIGMGPAGAKETEGLNPDNNQIEMHTAAEWRRIRNLHAQAVHGKAKKAKVPTVEEPVGVGGMALGDILEKTSVPINLAGDVSKLSAATWKKIVAAIDKTLKEPDHGAFDVAATTQLAAHAHSPRMKALLASAITTSAASVMQTAANEPEAVPANVTALAQLQTLIGQTRVSGSKTLMQGLLKDVQTVAANWHKAIASKLSTALAHTTVLENLNIVRQTLAAGPGGKQPTSATDPAFLAAQQADQQQAIKEQEAERKQLAAAEKKAHDSHNQKLAASIRAQIREVDQGLSEAHLNVAQLKAEYAKAVYEALKATIAEVGQAYESTGHMAATQLQISEAQAKQAGGIVDLGTFQAAVGTQIGAAEGQRGYDISQLGGLQGQDRREMEQKITELTLSIVNLQGSVQEQIRATVAQMNSERESHEALTTSQYKGLEIGEQLAGTNLAGYEEDASKQSGILTPGQVQGANEAEARFRERREAEEHEKEQQKAADEQFYAEHPATSTGEQQEREQALQNLGNEIGELKEAIQGNKKATEKLEETTKEGTKVMAQFTGSVTFQYNSQNYVVGQTSDLVNVPGVGG